VFLGSVAEFAKLWVNEKLTIYEKFVREYLGKSGKWRKLAIVSKAEMSQISASEHFCSKNTKENMHHPEKL